MDLRRSWLLRLGQYCCSVFIASLDPTCDGMCLRRSRGWGYAHILFSLEPEEATFWMRS